MSPVICMDCGAVTGYKEVEGSTSICDQCLDRRYPKGEENEK